MKGLLIGTDTELFLQDRNTGKIVSAEGLIKGSKHVPFVFDDENPYFSTSLDNVLAEFTIPPAKSLEEWKLSLQKSVAYIDSILPEHLCSVAIPSAHLDIDQLQTQNARMFGCEPDFNVWTGDVNRKEKGVKATLRSGGGHIHFGFDDPTPEMCLEIVKSADLHIAVPSVLMEPDNERKMLYGKAGAFRFKPYGVEYRTVSNYYMASEPLREWAYNAAIDTAAFVDAGNEIDAELGEAIVRAVNQCDKEIAANLIKQFKLKTA